MYYILCVILNALFYDRFPLCIHRSYTLLYAESEQVVLDHNALARQYEYVGIGVIKVAHDHSAIAYTIDTRGDDTHDAGTDSYICIYMCL